MSKRTIDPETLSAYVDGELDNDRAADVLAAAAADAAVARELSALSRLKATLAAGIDVPALELPATPPVRRRWRVAIAAMAAFVLVAAGVGGYLGYVANDRGPDPAWLAAAHASWSIEEAPAPGAGGPLHAASIREGAYVPDLSSAKLSIVHVGRHDTGRGTRALVVGYRGTRGCKVSLIVLPDADGPATGLAPVAVPDLAGFTWRAGRLAYVILAQGMAATRLSLIAAKVMEASRRRLPLDDAARTRLAQSRAESAPCRA